MRFYELTVLSSNLAISMNFSYFSIYLDSDWLHKLCFLHSGFYFVQPGGLCLSKSSFETFSFLSEECETLIRDFHLACK